MKLRVESKSVFMLGTFFVFLTACTPAISATLPTSTEAIQQQVFTPIPTFTPIPPATPTPPASLGTIALDFVSLLCNASWANGGQQLKTCPSSGTDHSGGYASAIDPATEGLPATTTALLTIPASNGYSSLFLRYPSFTVLAKDSFHATLTCPVTTPCDLQFALEYYDAAGKYHSPFMAWDYKSGEPPIQVDADLSALAGQTVDFVLTTRLFHNLDNPQKDNGLWISPYIYRPINQ